MGGLLSNPTCGDVRKKKVDFWAIGLQGAPGFFHRLAPACVISDAERDFDLPGWVPGEDKQGKQPTRLALGVELDSWKVATLALSGAGLLLLFFWALLRSRRRVDPLIASL